MLPPEEATNGSKGTERGHKGAKNAMILLGFIFLSACGLETKTY